MTDRIGDIMSGSYKIDLEDGGAIIKCDIYFSKMTGYTIEMLKERKMTFFDLVPPEDLTEYKKRVLELQARGGGAIKHKVVCADGGVLNVICIAVDQLIDGHMYSTVTITDISDFSVMQDRVRQSEAKIALLSDTSTTGIAIYRRCPDGHIEPVEVDDEFLRIFGESRGSKDVFIIDTSLCDEDFLQFSQEIKIALNDYAKHHLVLQLKAEKGGRWVSLAFRCEAGEEGSEMIYCSVCDITESQSAQKLIKKQNLCFQMVADNTDDIFFEYDVAADIFTSTSRKLLNKHGARTFDEFMATHRAEKYLHPDDRKAYNDVWENAVKAPLKGTIDYRTSAYEDGYHWYRMAFVSVADAHNVVANVYGMIYSIDHLKEMKNRIAADMLEIERLSISDHVTGLLTRAAFNERAGDVLREHFPKSGCVAFVYSDINDFSYINENYSYEAGDKMLRDFAGVLSTMPGLLLSCRVYSDFFLIMCAADNRESLMQEVARKNAEFAEQQKATYPRTDLKVSCGVYFAKTAEDKIARAIDNANLARRSVKGVTNVSCAVYTDRMRKKRNHDQAIESQILSAVKSGAIELFLQPKFSLDTRRIIGAEALTRWKNPDGSYKLPYEFIDVLESVGYITEVDLYIYEQVLKCLERWKREGKKLIPISVNFSRRHNSHPDFVDKVIALADRYGVDKSLLEIEVTESCLTQDVKNLFTNMRRLRDEGFKIDIDDFGTGYSSLSVLIDAPVDIVKVDKVFIDNIETNLKSRDYVKQICNLIQSTSKEIIFEGVETEEQAQILLDSGHNMAQGWLFDKAIPVHEFDEKYM